MATIIDFPADRIAAAPAVPGMPDALPSTGGRRCEYAVGDLARMLGIAHFAPRTIIDYLRAKAVQEAMPLPKTPRLWGGKLITGAQSIWLQSRWDAELFDGWQAGGDGDKPCPPASAALRAQLARRAEAIGKPVRLTARRPA